MDILIIIVISLLVLALLIFFLLKKRKPINATKIATKITDSNNILDNLIKADTPKPLAEKIFENYNKTKDLKSTLSQYLIKSQDSKDNKPKVIILVGINGAGKTTSIAKLAHFYKSQNKKVILGATDTFRAAGASQLSTWSNKLEVDIIEGEQNQDPASVAYKCTKKAIDENYDIALIDTSGRLQTNTNLMNELSKIQNVVSKLTPISEILLVIDSNIGSNSLSQAREFNKYVDLSGVLLTKFDSTSKGGIVFAIQDELKLPLKYIGTGETEKDLEVFDNDKFLNTFV